MDISLKDLSLIVRSKQHRLLYILKHKTRLPDFDFSDIKYLCITSCIFPDMILFGINIICEFPKERIKGWTFTAVDKNGNVDIHYIQQNIPIYLDFRELQDFDLTLIEAVDILLLYKATQSAFEPVNGNLIKQSYCYDTFHREFISK